MFDDERVQEGQRGRLNISACKIYEIINKNIDDNAQVNSNQKHMLSPNIRIPDGSDSHSNKSLIYLEYSWY